MTPRKPKQGASSSASRSSAKSARAASSAPRASTPKKKATTATRKPAAGKTAASKPAARQTSVRKTAGGKKAAPKKQPSSKWTAPALVLSAILVFVWTYYPVAAVQYREAREAKRLAYELDSVKARNERLRTQVERLKTPAGVEDYARTQLGLVKKGENVMVVVDKDSAETTGDAAAPSIDSAEHVREPVGPWTAFLDLVFGVR